MHRQRHAIGRDGADQRRAADHHVADRVRGVGEAFERHRREACGSIVWSMTPTDQPSASSQIVRLWIPLTFMGL